MLEIKKAIISDVEFVKKLENEAGLSVWLKEDYILEIERTDSLFWVAKEDQKSVGFLIARLIMYQTQNVDFFSFENEIEIYNVAVIEGYRKKKIGTMMLEKIVRTAKNRGVGKIRLEVRKSNRNALEFYKKNLFQIDGERKDFYSNPTEPAILMTRKIRVP